MQAYLDPYHIRTLVSRLIIYSLGDNMKNEFLGLLIGCGLVAGASLGIFAATLGLCGLFILGID
jgi:hypothetical protein